MESRKVPISVKHLKGLMSHSQYIKNVIKYNPELNPENTTQDTMYLSLPPLLTLPDFQRLFAYVVTEPLGGDRAKTLRIWQFVREMGYTSALHALFFLDLTEILEKMTKQAILVNTQQCAPFIVDLIEVCGIGSEQTELALKLLSEVIKFEGDRQRLLELVGRKDGKPGLSKSRLAKYIYSARRRLTYKALMQTRQCPVCEQVVHYYYKDFKYGIVPNVKKAFQMKCCAWPVHKQCYWEKIVCADTCKMCNTNLEQEASIISEYQIDEGSIFRRNKIRNEFGYQFWMQIATPRRREEEAHS